MYAPTAYIADDNRERFARLRDALDEAHFQAVDMVPGGPVDAPADVLFVAGDSPNSSGFTDLIESFARCAPAAPVLVLTESPLWKLVTLAVRKRAWMDIPRTDGYDDLLTRYAISRTRSPKIIVESSVARCDELLNQWRESQTDQPELVLVHTVGSALEAAINGSAPVLLNLSISPGGSEDSSTATLIYSLCPSVIAVLIEASNTRRSYNGFLHTDPCSRFALIRLPFDSSEILGLLDTMHVNWPMSSPL